MIIYILPSQLYLSHRLVRVDEELHLVVPGTNAAKRGVEHGLIDAEIVPPPVADSRHLKLDVALVAAGNYHRRTRAQCLQR